MAGVSHSTVTQLFVRPPLVYHDQMITEVGLHRTVHPPEFRRGIKNQAVEGRDHLALRELPEVAALPAARTLRVLSRFGLKLVQILSNLLREFFAKFLVLHQNVRGGGGGAGFCEQRPEAREENAQDDGQVGEVGDEAGGQEPEERVQHCCKGAGSNLSWGWGGDQRGKLLR